MTLGYSPVNNKKWNVTAAGLDFRTTRRWPDFLTAVVNVTERKKYNKKPNKPADEPRRNTKLENYCCYVYEASSSAHHCRSSEIKVSCRTLCVSYYIIIALFRFENATYSSTWKRTHLPRNLVHLQVYGTYFKNNFTTVKSSLFESARNSLLLFCLVIFTCTDICEDQAKSDGVDCTVSTWQSSFSIKFGRNYVVVTLSAVLDRRARIPRQDIGNKLSAKLDLMPWNS